MSSGKKYSNKDSLEWLKSSQVTSVLSLALGELYLSKPQNQLFFLGNWLVNYSKSRNNLNVEAEKAAIRETLQEQFLKSQETQKQHEEHLKQEAEKLKKREEDLKNEICSVPDIYDSLGKVSDYLKEYTFAAAAYVGLLEKLKRPVTDQDDEKAHIDEEAPLVLRYITASQGSHWMVGQMLKEEEGQATWSVWKEDEEEENQDEEDPPVKKSRLKIVSVDDVVSDPRIKFFDVPKLGAYLAAPVTYASCLLDSSFDAGVEDALDCRKKRAAQEEERQKYEASKTDEDEGKVFEEIKEEKFRTNDVKLVLALDTLGLDKPFNDDQKDYIVDWALLLKQELERSEEQALRRDITEYLAIKDWDNQRFHDKSNEWAEEDKNCTEEVLKTLGATASEEAKQHSTFKALFELNRNRVLADLPVLLKFRNFRVLKHARVFQLAFYIAGVSKDRLVEPGTNLILWKTGRELLNDDFADFVRNLDPFGPKSQKPEAYAKTCRLEKDLLRVSFEEVQGFSISLGFLYKFLEFYLKSRIADVAVRRKAYLNKVEEREVAQNAARELNERKMKYLEDMKEAFDKEMDAVDDEKPIFDHVKAMNEFDAIEGNSPVVIPDPPVCDVDEDIDWEESNPSS